MTTRRNPNRHYSKGLICVLCKQPRHNRSLHFCSPCYRPMAKKNRAKCTHHWKVDTPSGTASLGACKLCGLVRFFDNFVEPSLREQQIAELKS